MGWLLQLISVGSETPGEQTRVHLLKGSCSIRGHCATQQRRQNGQRLLNGVLCRGKPNQEGEGRPVRLALPFVMIGGLHELWVGKGQKYISLWRSVSNRFTTDTLPVSAAFHTSYSFLCTPYLFQLPPTLARTTGSVMTFA